MDYAKMSIAELQKIKKAIEKEIEGRQKKQRNQALGEIKSVAAKYGLKLADVVGGAAPQRKTRKAAEKTAAKPAKKTAKKVAAKKNILYRHPDNPQLTWGGGRGRRPQWVKDWEAAGRSLDEAKA